jgi:site-specific recombinase XerD
MLSQPPCIRPPESATHAVCQYGGSLLASGSSDATSKCGITTPWRHVFRHSLATHMLNRGATLPEIGELLRHRRPDTTTIYAKVDLRSVRTIALPRPGENR